MKKRKKLKDVDSVRQAAVLQNFVRTLPFLGLLGLVLDGVTGLLLGAATSAGVAFATEVFSGALGAGFVQTLFGIGRRTSSLRERMAGDLNIAKNHKMNQRFDAALFKLDEILSRDPDFPEALLLKSQVLWEGLRDHSGARNCLVSVMKIEPDKDATFHRWALSLYRDINRMSQ